MPEEPRRGEGEGSFRVSDRRRAGREGVADAPQEGAPAAGAEPAEAGQPAGEAPSADIRLLPVADVVRIFIGELHARAWVHLGLRVDPATNQAARDLPQARLAIDCLASLMEHLGPLADEAERRDLERLLADLRINYARQAGP